VLDYFGISGFSGQRATIKAAREKRPEQQGGGKFAKER
jgi:hypothetical protein